MTFPVERVADGPRVQYGFGFVADDGAWKRVRKVTALPDEVETWCLRVEEDESFHAEGCIVKNCPLQTDIVDRLINQFSNAGELVFDPFAGLGTVPSRAIALGRRGAGVELNEGYFRDALRYCRLAEAKAAVPSLFDALDAMAIAELEDEVSA